MVEFPLLIVGEVAYKWGGVVKMFKPLLEIIVSKANITLNVERSREAIRSGTLQKYHGSEYTKDSLRGCVIQCSLRAL